MSSSKRDNLASPNQNQKHKEKMKLSKSQTITLKYYAGLAKEDDRPSSWINSMRSLIRLGLLDENRDFDNPCISRPKINEKGLSVIHSL